MINFTDIVIQIHEIGHSLIRAYIALVHPSLHIGLFYFRRRRQTLFQRMQEWWNYRTMPLTYVSWIISVTRHMHHVHLLALCLKYVAAVVNSDEWAGAANASAAVNNSRHTRRFARRDIVWAEKNIDSQFALMMIWINANEVDRVKVLNCSLSLDDVYALKVWHRTKTSINTITVLNSLYAYTMILYYANL